MIKIPALFLNHGGGPMPLMGQQPSIVEHIQQVRSSLDIANVKPKSIVVISAHWECKEAIEITSSLQPPMLYDYYGFPKESYTYQYPAPGSPQLAQQIQSAFALNGIDSKLNAERGYDHGVFIPLMILYPEATIPVVCVSLHASLDAKYHIKIGQALQPILQDPDSDILLIGSGYTFHNMNSFFNPSPTTFHHSELFNTWLKDTMLHSKAYNERIDKLQSWEQLTQPYGRQCHPREEHLLPLLVITAAAGPNATPIVSYNINSLPDNNTIIIGTKQQTEKHQQQHAISSYTFEINT